jgi:hypothetical protein
MSTASLRRIAGAAIATLGAGAVLAAPAAAAPEAAPTTAAGGELAEVKRATARYHRIAPALEAGYQPAGHCTEEPGVGAMGYHFAKEELVADPALDPRRPEILVYERRGHGLRLVAVEYFSVDADQNLDTDDDRPSLFDRPFDGPMLGHEPGMPIHYDLHAWVWKHNPAGVFAQYNPRVSCP